MKTENGNGKRIIRKRIKSAIICLLMALSLAVSNFAGLNLGEVKVHASLTDEGHGEGTQAEPYKIYNYEDLVEFAQIVNNGNCGAYAKLMNDIECKYSGSNVYDTNWVPIGDLLHLYTGTFYGNGKKIIGLNNTGIGTVSDCQGLFGCIGTGGNVENIIIEDCNIQGKDVIGGLVGGNNGIITNCSIIGKVTGTGINGEIGGVVGSNLATIIGCKNMGEISGSNVVGGVVGVNSNGGSVTNCYNTGKVEGSNCIGGVVGLNTNVASVTNCYNTGKVGGSTETGGVVGLNTNGGSITSCYNTGTVTATNQASLVGGVVGMKASGTITNCYHDKTRSMVDKAIGNVEPDPETVKGLTTAEMTGSTAFTKMVFSYADENQNPWMAKADSSSAEGCYWYYPHLIGFDFTDNSQTPPDEILSVNWPAKVKVDFVLDEISSLSTTYNGNEQKISGMVIVNPFTISEGCTDVRYNKFVTDSWSDELSKPPTEPGVYRISVYEENEIKESHIFSILQNGTNKDYFMSYQKKTGINENGESIWGVADTFKNIGTYKVGISFTEPGHVILEKEFAITPKSIAVSANSGSKVYGEADPALTYSSDALIGNDSFTGSLSRVSGENTGEYDIEINTLSAGGNYNINYTGAKLTITPKSLGSDAIRLSAEEFEYDGTAKTPEVFVYDGETKIPDSEFTYRILNNVNAGTATVEVSDVANGNYTVSGTKTFSIKEALVTVAADDKSKVYGEDDPVFTATVTGLKGNDTADLIKYTFSRMEGEDTGTYVVTPSGNEIQGNYKVSYVQGTLVINKKLAGIKTAPAAFTGLKYSGNEQALIQVGTAEDSCTILYVLGKNASDVPAADTEGTPEAEKKWKSAIPSGKNAGTYYVWYKIASDTNHTGTEAACIPVTISKANPEYVVPTGLKIETGKKLSDVALPEHWSWADPGQSVGNAGSNTFKAVYTPVDTDNYNVVNSIDVTVEVTEPEPEPEPEPEQEPEPNPDPEPETPSSYTNKYVYAYNVGDQPKTTNNTTDSNNKTEKTVNNPDGSVSKITTVKNPDNSVTTITETTNKEGKVTKTTETVKKYPSGGVKTDTKTEYPDGTVKTEKKTEYSSGTKTYTSTTQNADGSSSKTYIRETAAGKKTEKQYSFDAEGNGTYSVTNSNKNGVTFSESFDITGTDAVLTSFFTNKKKATVPKTILVAGIERLITAIAEGAFKGNTSIKNIRVEADITTIAESAFSGAINLKKLFLPATLTSIGKNAFAGIPKLTIYIKADDKKAYDEAAKTLKQLLKKAGIDPDIITIKREK